MCSFGQRAIPPCSWRFVLVWIVVGGFVSARGDDGTGDARKALPKEADQTKLLALLKDVFKDEYAVKTPQGRLALCKKLLDQSKKPGNDDGSLYVMLREALDQSVALGDVDTSYEALTELTSQFAVDAERVESESLAALAKVSRSPAGYGQLATKALKLVERLAEREDFNGASKALTTATLLAAKSGDKTMQKTAADRTKSLQAAKDEFAKLNAARETLIRDPENKDAHLIYGRYLCLNKDEWSEAMAHFAKTADGALKDLAEKELADGENSKRPAELGNGWFALAEKASDKANPPMKILFLQRARYWYAKAAPLAGGLEKAVLEKRLASLNAELSTTPLTLKSLELNLPGDVKMKFQPIPAGKFTMGPSPNDPPRKEDDAPRKTTISKPFYLAKTELTRAQFAAILGSSVPPKEKANLPAVEFDWATANLVCQRLTTLFAEKKYRFRLPTEAEWEYACRAGTTTNFSFGTDPSKLSEYAWTANNANGEPHPAAQLKPNAWGLYDMHGNVSEWCADSYLRYDPNATVDPIQRTPTERRVMRGGSFLNSERESMYPLLSAGRGAHDKNENRPYIGMRVLLEAP